MVVEYRFAKKKKEGFTPIDRQRIVGILWLTVFFSLSSAESSGFPISRMRVPLGVLDQSPRHQRAQSAEAIAETVELARLAEELGYTATGSPSTMPSRRSPIPAPRSWSRASPPATSRIRVGTGGCSFPTTAR